MGIFDKIGKVLGGGGGEKPAEPVITEDTEAAAPVTETPPLDQPADDTAAPQPEPPAEESADQQEARAKEAAAQLERDLASGDDDLKKTVEDVGGTMKME
jgi:hypothetical protein